MRMGNNLVFFKMGTLYHPKQQKKNILAVAWANADDDLLIWLLEYSKTNLYFSTSSFSDNNMFLQIYLVMKYAITLFPWKLLINEDKSLKTGKS